MSNCPRQWYLGKGSRVFSKENILRNAIIGKYANPVSSSNKDEITLKALIKQRSLSISNLGFSAKIPCLAQ
jgi:hypothetical protein